LAINLANNTEVANFIDSQTIAHLATLLKDGSPQVSPLGLYREGDLVCVNVAAGTLKARNMRRDPRVALSIHAPDASSGFHSYMLLRGNVVDILEGQAGHASFLALMGKVLRLSGASPVSGELGEADVKKVMSDVQSAVNPSAHGTEPSEGILPPDEPRIGFRISVDHIHHFLLQGRGIVVSVTEEGEKSHAINDVGRHKLWQRG
jgi:PPOX class probable F420-dependent enzyme